MAPRRRKGPQKSSDDSPGSTSPPHTSLDGPKSSHSLSSLARVISDLLISALLPAGLAHSSYLIASICRPVLGDHTSTTSSWSFAIVSVIVVASLSTVLQLGDPRSLCDSSSKVSSAGDSSSDSARFLNFLLATLIFSSAPISLHRLLFPLSGFLGARACLLLAQAVLFWLPASAQIAIWSSSFRARYGTSTSRCTGLLSCAVGICLASSCWERTPLPLKIIYNPHSWLFWQCIVFCIIVVLSKLGNGQENPKTVFATFRRVDLRLTAALLVNLAALASWRYLAPESGDGISNWYRQYIPSDSRVLARGHSVTGTLSVIEHRLGSDRWIRVLRCDHSILGGLWLEDPDSDLDAAQLESIYTAFHLQEAVRLVERPWDTDDPAKEHESPSALIIGAGVGIAVNGLERHGIRSTLVEIDPLVYRYARDHFGLMRPSGGVVLQDARVFLRSTDLRFEYIVHDVFTGGTMPLQLLTDETFHDIRERLSPGGIAVVNFAGDPHSQTGRRVIATILANFATCRAFRDNSNNRKDMNLAFICSDEEIVFRPAMEADYLGSVQRKKALQGLAEREFRPLASRGTSVLTDGNVKSIDVSKERWAH